MAQLSTDSSPSEPPPHPHARITGMHHQYRICLFFCTLLLLLSSLLICCSFGSPRPLPLWSQFSAVQGTFPHPKASHLVAFFLHSVLLLLTLLVPSFSAHSASSSALLPLQQPTLKTNSRHSFSCGQVLAKANKYHSVTNMQGPQNLVFLYTDLHSSLLKTPRWLRCAVQSSSQLCSLIWSKSKESCFPTCLLLVSQGIISFEMVLSSEPGCPSKTS